MTDGVKQGRFRILREIASWIAWLGGAAILVLVLRYYIFTFVIVDGDSMEATLHDGEVMAVSILSYKVGEPQRGDVVVCDYPNSADHYVKRVVGLPGEAVMIRDGIVYVNGIPLEEPYILEEPFYDMQEQIVPANSYFVLGDNRNHSSDSRAVGPIGREALLGRALAVAWPPDSLRAMKNTVALGRTE